ncbi:MAG: DUF3460 family protein [Kingella sp. (in: b-proteobacteria)]
MAYNYQSDATQFLNKLMEEHPELQTERLANRGLLWDVNLNADEQKGYEEAKIAKKPYTYQPD